jgi:hypothetical protein
MDRIQISLDEAPRARRCQLAVTETTQRIDRENLSLMCEHTASD